MMITPEPNTRPKFGATCDTDGFLHRVALSLDGYFVREHEHLIGIASETALQYKPEHHRRKLRIELLRLADGWVDFSFLDDNRRVPPIMAHHQSCDDRVAHALLIFGGMKAMKIDTSFQVAETQPGQVLSQQRRIVGPGDSEGVVMAASWSEVEVAGFVEVGVKRRHAEAAEIRP